MDTTKISIGNEVGVEINKDMIGLFFEDINYAADGGLYGELLENRSFEFLRAEGQAGDYYTEYDGGYGWSAFPSNSVVKMRTVMGSPLTEENPHYMRVETSAAGAGISNKAYEGLYLQSNMSYKIVFWARCVNFSGCFIAYVVKEGQVCAQTEISSTQGKDMTYNHFAKYEMEMIAHNDIDGAEFVICLDEEGIVEFDFISMFPGDSVAGLFRKDLFEKLKDLKPGFIRFPGGCIVEGNTYDNRYRFKDSLKPVWARKNNWNRWAVHETKKEMDYVSPYCHYNQTLGLGYYEYFLLCELIGCEPLPVMNVGFACQYQSNEIVTVKSDEFKQCIQDTLDLIEFANGTTDTTWGKVRAQMGHEAPFNLKMLGIGNEQWETEKADFFNRYSLFEQAIHDKEPNIRLIGSAGPNITSDHYTDAWKFYHENKAKESFVYAVDEHYYVKPQWLLDHTDFYDDYDRAIKVFSGEYAAHPCSGMNMPQTNTLGGAIAEAAFLTGVERNADVVVLASYAPLFARIGYAQWSPDMIWFDAKTSYATPSYYVQQMFSHNMGTLTMRTYGQEKGLAAKQIYYNLSIDEVQRDLILKIVNANDYEQIIMIEGADLRNGEDQFKGQILTGPGYDSHNSCESPTETAPKEISGRLKDGVCMPAWSFAVIRF